MFSIRARERLRQLVVFMRNYCEHFVPRSDIIFNIKLFYVAIAT